MFNNMELRQNSVNNKAEEYLDNKENDSNVTGVKLLNQTGGNSEYTNEVLRSSKGHNTRTPDLRFEVGLNYKCHQCNNEVSVKQHLNKHIHSSGRNYYKCIHCKKIFLSKRTHLIQNLKSEMISYLCNICGKGYKTIKLLQSHKIKHNSEQLHTCSVCKKKFNKKIYLIMHIKSHISEEKYICGSCGDYFNAVNTLHAHEFNHQKENKLTCYMCNTKFDKTDSLIKHKLEKHLDNCKCKVCNKICKTLYMLKVHMRKHCENKKDFSCKECKQRFTTAGNLFNHKMLHVEAFEKMCNKYFN